MKRKKYKPRDPAPGTAEELDQAIQAARREGAKARADGKDLSDNPYQYGDNVMKRQAWRNGWKFGGRSRS